MNRREMSGKYNYTCGSTTKKSIFGCESCTAQVLRRNGLQDDICWSYYGPLPDCCCQTCKRQMDLLWRRRNCVNYRHYCAASPKCGPPASLPLELPCNRCQKVPVCSGGCPPCPICGTYIPCIFKQKYTMDETCQNTQPQIFKESKSIGSLSLTLTVDCSAGSSSSDDLCPCDNKPDDEYQCEDKNCRFSRRGTSKLNNPTACSKFEKSTTETMQCVPCGESDYNCSIASASKTKYKCATIQKESCRKQKSSQKHIPKKCICKSEERMKYDCHTNRMKCCRKRKTSKNHICKSKRNASLCEESTNKPIATIQIEFCRKQKSPKKHVPRKSSENSSFLSTCQKRMSKNRNMRNSSCCNAYASHIMNFTHLESTQNGRKCVSTYQIPHNPHNCNKNAVCRHNANIRMMYRRYMCLRPHSTCRKFFNPYLRSICDYYSQLQHTSNCPKIKKRIKSTKEPLKIKQTKRKIRCTVKAIETMNNNTEKAGFICQDRFVQTDCLEANSISQSSNSVITPVIEVVLKYKADNFEKNSPPSTYINNSEDIPPVEKEDSVLIVSVDDSKSSEKCLECSVSSISYRSCETVNLGALHPPPQSTCSCDSSKNCGNTNLSEEYRCDEKLPFACVQEVNIPERPLLPSVDLRASQSFDIFIPRCVYEQDLSKQQPPPILELDYCENSATDLNKADLVNCLNERRNSVNGIVSQDMEQSDSEIFSRRRSSSDKIEISEYPSPVCKIVIDFRKSKTKYIKTEQIDLYDKDVSHALKDYESSCSCDTKNF